MLKPIKVLLTACGCPGASTLIRMLRANGERTIEILGVDMDAEAAGRFMVDRFFRVPPVTETAAYLERMLEITAQEAPDVLLPEGSFEVPILADQQAAFEALGTRVLVSSPESIRLANNKFEMYQALQGAGIPLPRYGWPRSLDEFVALAEDLGFPQRAVAFKPHVAKGSRGFRIIDPAVNRRQLLMDYKPNSRYMAMDEFINIFRQETDFPDFLLMEKLEGEETTADSLCLEGVELLTTIKTVEQARWGVIVRGELIRAEHLVAQTRQILARIALSYNVNLQFIGEVLIEINPRVSSFIFQDDLIAPYLAIKLALGEIDADGLAAYRRKIAYGRRLVRYFDVIHHQDGSGAG